MRLNEKEALRYLGFRGRPADAETVRAVREIGAALEKSLQPKCVSRRYAVRVSDTAVELDGWRIESVKLARHLRGAEAAYLFAATLGVQADAMVRRYAVRGAAAGAVADAVCSALIEDYCDEMQARLAAEEARNGLFLRPRFSPGYGDFAREPAGDLSAARVRKAHRRHADRFAADDAVQIRHGGDRRHRLAGLRLQQVRRLYEYGLRVSRGNGGAGESARERRGGRLRR